MGVSGRDLCCWHVALSPAGLSPKALFPGSRGGGGAAASGCEDPRAHHKDEDGDPGEVPITGMRGNPGEVPITGMRGDQGEVPITGMRGGPR